MTKTTLMTVQLEIDANPLFGYIFYINPLDVYVIGCMGMKALGRTDMDNQNKIVKFGGIRPLVRLLRSPKTSKLVLLVVIRVLGTLCVGRWQHSLTTHYVHVFANFESNVKWGSVAQWFERLTI